MITARFWTVLVLLFVGVVQASAEENAECDRDVAKELGYESNVGYFRLAVGSELKSSVCVVAEGDILHVDRKGDHGLAGAEEKISLKDGRLSKPLEMIIGNTPVTIVRLDKWFGGFFVTVDVKGKRLQYGVVLKPARHREVCSGLAFRRATRDGPSDDRPRQATLPPAWLQAE